MASCDDGTRSPQNVLGAPSASQGREGPQRARRPYRRPEIVQYGAVQELTRGGSVMMNADISMMTMGV